MLPILYHCQVVYNTEEMESSNSCETLKYYTHDVNNHDSDDDDVNVFYINLT